MVKYINIKFTVVPCLNVQFSNTKYILHCLTTIPSIISRTFSSSHTEPLSPWNANSTSPVPGPNHLFSVSMNLTTLCILHKWDTVFVFLWQTLHSTWYSQGSAMSLPVSEPPSFLRLMFHCKYMLPFMCPFIHWWSLGCLPSLGHCD